MRNLGAAAGTLLGLWLLFNLIGAVIVGALARRILPGKDDVGWFKTIAIGFLGGMLGKILAYLFGFRHLGWLGGFLVSILGAMLLLIVHRTTRRKKSPEAPAKI